MISITYVSSATRSFSTVDLAKLLEAWRINNAARGVTGMLLFKDGNFMQVIEGEEANVRGLYEKLHLEPRHTGMLKLLEEKIDVRFFQDWSMGFENLDEKDLGGVPGYLDYRDVSFLSQIFASQPSRAKKLLEMFRRRM
jgi:hypothetical protein